MNSDNGGAVVQLNGSDEDAKIEDRQGPGDEERMMDHEEPSREDDELKGGLSIPEEHPEARRPRGVRDPRAPTPEQRAEHELHHANYREWCRACVRGRGIAAPHRKQHKDPDDPDGVPSVHFDYCFMGEKDQEEEKDEDKENAWRESDEMLKILTVKLKTFKRIRAHLVPKKGVSGQPWIAKAVADDIKIWGCSSVILRSDQEKSLKAIHHEVQKLRAPLMTIPEHSPKGESQSNGVIERGNRTITEQVRVMIIDLEEKLECKISAKHPIMSWLVEHAAFIVSYLQTGTDGKTPYERHKGKRANLSLCAFGEQIHYMPLKGKGRPGKRNPRYLDGIWLGISEVNGEVFVGTPEGVQRTRSVLHRPDKRSKDRVQAIKGFPWKHEPTEDGVEGGAPKVQFEERVPDLEPRPPDAEVPEAIPRRLRISRQDLAEQGFTVGCAGCEAQRGNKARKPHSEECRARILEALGGTEEGKKIIDDAVKRIHDHAARRGPVEEPQPAAAREPRGEDAREEERKRPAEDRMEDIPKSPREEEAPSGSMPGSSKDAEADYRFRTPPQKRAMSEAADSDRGGKFQTIADEEEIDRNPPALYSPTSPAKSGDNLNFDNEAQQTGMDETGMDGNMEADIIERMASALTINIDCEKNLESIEKLRRKFGKLGPQK